MTANPQDKNGDSRKPQASFAELVRKMALASVGLAVLAQEEVEEFVGKLVQKGELAEKDGKSLVKDLAEKRKQGENGAHAVTTAIDSTVDKVLHKINVPTKGDVEELARKIEEIDKKIEALAAKRSG
ncbi:MAG TPA: phasin family protein [Planctomycetota bacterium]|nr:phasin family protein [Planctomycetota bacterium]